MFNPKQDKKNYFFLYIHSHIFQNGGINLVFNLKSHAIYRMLGLAIDLIRYPYQRDVSYDRHKDVIKKLKFIARIESGERINVSTVSTTSHNLFSSLYRSIFKESRSKTFQFLNEVIDRSFELIVLYQESTKISDRITCSQILEDLVNSVTGLRNLQVTYADDRNFYCDIDTLIGSIFARLAEFYEGDIHITPDIKEKIRSIVVPLQFKHEKEQLAEQKEFVKAQIKELNPVKEQLVVKEEKKESVPMKEEKKESVKEQEHESVKEQEHESVKEQEHKHDEREQKFGKKRQ